MIGKTLLNGIFLLRWLAIIAALVYVGINLIKTVRKAQQGQVIVSIMEKDLAEYLFPSITVCSKYNDGKSDVLPIIWRNPWNNSGQYLIFVHSLYFIQKSLYYGRLG